MAAEWFSKDNVFAIEIYKTVVRSGIRTHAHRSGLRPERSALDLSAILTMSSVHECSNAVHPYRSHEAITVHHPV